MTLYIGGTIASVVLGTLLRFQMGNLKANMQGDPEKQFLDECMRDYENLNTEDTKYRSQYSKCIEDLSNEASLKRLPHIRLTVDYRVCDPADLCSGGDPGQCEDIGIPMAPGYTPGDVMKCYMLIDDAKAEQDAYKKFGLLDRVAAECTNKDKWNDYANSVSLAYCFWKHLQFGVCTNIMRTNCPELGDSSCCPIAQSDPLNAVAYRQDQYVCRKSPVAGLFCQQKDYRVAVNVSIQPRGELCTKVTCPSFAWCRDLADIPGECYGDACKDHRRAVEFLIICIVCASMGLVCDVVVIGHDAESSHAKHRY
jgi:hypothetical protein